MTIRYIREDTAPTPVTIGTSQAVTKYDLVALQSDTLVRAEDQTWNTNLAQTQEDFARFFLGVSHQTKAANTARIPGNSADNLCMVDTEGVYSATCVSATFKVGDFVGPAKATGNALLSQTVVGVATENLAVGRVVESGTSVTVVKFKLLSAISPAARQGVPGDVGAFELNTAISTVGAGTLTAQALVGGVITRTGPTGAYTDTTDTAANIIADIPADAVGQSWEVTIKNTVPYAQTLSGGTGVTLSGQTIIPPNSVGRFLLTQNAATTVTMVGLFIAPMTTVASPLVATALTTVGAGTITAAGIAGGITTRTGSTSAFTDTTDTAANIIAARPNWNVGDSFSWTYQNGTDAVATLTGGTGVTVSGGTIVGNGCWTEYLVTYSAASTVTIAAIRAGSTYTGLPDYQYVTNTTTTTFAAGQLTGAKFNVYNSTATTPGSIATRTATQMFGDIPNAFVGMSFITRIINSSGSANTMTVTFGTGVTQSGTTTYTIAEFAYRDFLITFTAATTCTMVAIGGGAAATN